MSWIKRNLALVISGVVAIALLGLGGWYFYSAVDKNTSIDNEINQTKSEIDRLLNMEPSPVQSNLNGAQQELARLNAFITQAKKLFPPTPPPAEPLNNESFKSLLETAVNDMHKQAASVGIKVPPPTEKGPYYFTFENQRLPVTFPFESLRPLSERLSEVQALMSILFKSRINRLGSIRRAMVPGEGFAPGTQGAPSDYLNVSPHTNAEASMVLWPYELRFECFSSELGSVMEALERSPDAFVVKSPVLEPAEELRTVRENQRMVRDNPRGFPGRTNAPVAAPAGTLTTVVNERLLRVTLRVEVIKPETIQPGGGGPGQGRGGGPNQGRGGGNRGGPQGRPTGPGGTP